MKNKLIIYSVFLVIILCLSWIVGCGGGNGSGTIPNVPQQIPTNPNVTPIVIPSETPSTSTNANEFYQDMGKIYNNSKDIKAKIDILRNNKQLTSSDISNLVTEIKIKSAEAGNLMIKLDNLLQQTHKKKLNSSQAGEVIGLAKSGTDFVKAGDTMKNGWEQETEELKKGNYTEDFKRWFKETYPGYSSPEEYIAINGEDMFSGPANESVVNLYEWSGLWYDQPVWNKSNSQIGQGYRDFTNFGLSQYTDAAMGFVKDGIADIGALAGGIWDVGVKVYDTVGNTVDISEVKDNISYIIGVENNPQNNQPIVVIGEAKLGSGINVPKGNYNYVFSGIPDSSINNPSVVNVTIGTNTTTNTVLEYIVPSYYAQFKYKSSDVTVQRNQSAEVRIEFWNRGTTSWDKNVVHLGTSDPRDRNPHLYTNDNNWIPGSPSNRIKMQQTLVKPGEVAEFIFYVTPDSQFWSSNQTFELVADADYQGIPGKWFGDVANNNGIASVYVTVTDSNVSPTPTLPPGVTPTSTPTLPPGVTPTSTPTLPPGVTPTSTPTVTPGSSAPTISSISPSSRAYPPGTFTLTINGSGFDSGAVDQFYKPDGSYMGSGALSGGLVSRNSTQIVVTETMNSEAAGTYTVKVKNSDGTYSNGITFTITGSSGSTPTISSISPSSRAYPPGTFTLTINGSGFDSGAVDQFYKPDGSYMGSGALSGGLVSRNSTQIVITETMNSELPGTYTVKVKNSDGTYSNGVTFTITGSSGPSISSISPSSRAYPPGTFTLTINGSGFDSGAVDQFYKPDGSYMGSGALSGGLVSRNSTQIVITETMNSELPGTYTVKVKNSNGTYSNGVTFTITGSSGPSISSISPSSRAYPPGTFTLTINGSGFDSGAVDQFYKPDGSYMGSGALSGGLVSRNSTQIVITETMNSEPTGNYTVKVKNSNGTYSNGVTFSIY